MRKRINHFTITDDPNQIQERVVWDLLKEAYWSKDRTEQDVLKSFKHSLCISVLDGDKQVGFARVVTDRTFFAWIADVIIAPEYRGHGLGKSIMQFIQDHPHIPQSKQVLKTLDAHSLYEKFGFRKDEVMSK